MWYAVLLMAGGVGLMVLVVLAGIALEALFADPEDME